MQKNSTTSIAKPSNRVGRVQKAIKVTQSSGAIRISQGLNFPLGFLLLAYIRSIRIPIKGSLTASQMFQINSRAARIRVSTCRILV